MKLLQNKSTGEIGCLICSFGKTPEKITIVEYIDGRRGSRVWYYDSLAELNKEWKDYEEPKAGYIIDPMEEDCIYDAKFGVDLECIERAKELGIWFETKEETEKAVEKLKAWKRLKDNGVKFSSYECTDSYQEIQDKKVKNKLLNVSIKCKMPYDCDIRDVNLIFRGEE